MATVNSVGNGLSGATGTGNFVGATSPTLVTPTLGAASATSLTFSSTSGIIGTTTNNNAAAGSVGEVIQSQIAIGSAVSITSNAVTNLTSISLTAGDWDVWGNVNFFPNTTTTLTNIRCGISTTTAVLPDASLNSSMYAGAQTGANLPQQGLAAPYQRISLASTTTVYIVALTVFSISTCTMGGMITARRAR